MRKHFLGFAVLFGLAAGLNAQETYSTWSGHRNIYLNTQSNGAAVSGDVVNFPVLVRLAAKDSAIFAASLAGGIDLRFTKAGDIVRLKHQIDSWDATTRTAAVWVLVDTVKGGNGTQFIRMHWGKTGAADSSNGTAVFANGFTNVWHLGDTAAAVARANSITGGNAAMPTNFPSAYAPPTGIIGKGEYLRGGNGNAGSINNDYLNLGSITTNYSGGFSFSMWVKPDVLGFGTAFYTASETSADGAGLIVIGIQCVANDDFSCGAKLRQRNVSSNGNTGIISTNGEMYSIMTGWSHVVYTQNAAGDMDVYLNGTLVNTAQGMELFSSNTRAVNQIGTTLAHMNYADSSFHGALDEARLANTGRSADWVKLEYANQREVQNLLSDTLPPVSIGPNLKGHSRQSSFAHIAGRDIVFQASGLDRGHTRVSVSDMQGHVIWEGVFVRGSNRLVWDASRAPSGVYFARLSVRDSRGRISSTLQAKIPLTR